MVEILARRHEPHAADLHRALHIAEALEKKPASPAHLRAFASHLVVDVHRGAGWDLPAGASLASCHAAAGAM